MLNSGKVRTCRPSAFFWRKALRKARTKAEIYRVAMEMVLDLEAHKEAIRKHGLIPPKRRWAPGERETKQRGVIVPFLKKI